MPSMVSAWNHVRKGRSPARSRQITCAPKSVPLITDPGYWTRGGRAGHHRRPLSPFSPKRLYHEAFHDILHTKRSGDLENQTGICTSRGDKRIKRANYHDPGLPDRIGGSRGEETTGTHVIANPADEIYHTPNRYAGRQMIASIEATEDVDVRPDPLEKADATYWATIRHCAPTSSSLLKLPTDA